MIKNAATNTANTKGTATDTANGTLSKPVDSAVCATKPSTSCHTLNTTDQPITKPTAPIPTHFMIRYVIAPILLGTPRVDRVLFPISPTTLS